MLTTETIKLWRNNAKITAGETAEDDPEHIAAKAILALTAELLANREAQPVAWHFPGSDTESAQLGYDHELDDEQKQNCIALYAAPPAPAVPDALVNDIDSDDHPLLWSYNNGWNACRAAMLTQPVSSGYKLPDGWIACSERMPTPFVDVIASDGKQTICAHVIEDRWWCIVSETAEEPGPIIFWMPLPAAPEGGN
ncbi:TPA: DUF551 domain-containing protein [Serratia marcescens]